MLLNLVEADLQRPTRRSYALTPATQLLVALRFYATGSFLEILGDGHGISKASVSRSVQAVTSALLRHIPDHSLSLRGAENQAVPLSAPPRGLKNFMKFNRTWHLHTMPKLPVPGLRTMVSLFLKGSLTAKPFLPCHSRKMTVWCVM